MQKEGSTSLISSYITNNRTIKQVELDAVKRGVPVGAAEGGSETDRQTDWQNYAAQPEDGAGQVGKKCGRERVQM